MATEAPAPTAYIDTLLKRVAARGNLGIRFEAGAPVRVTGGNGTTRDVTNRSLTQQEIMGAIAPIVPDHAKRQLPQQSSVEFDYTCRGVGEFSIVIRHEGDQLMVAIDPAPAAPVLEPVVELVIETAAASTPVAAVWETPVVETFLAPAPAPAPVVAAAPQPPPPSALASTGAHAIDRLFRIMFEKKASDLHLNVGMTPLIRKDGGIQPLEAHAPALDTDSVAALLYPIIPKSNREEFEQRHDTGFAYEVAGLARFRCNVFMDRKGPGAVFRIIPSKILTAEDLNLSKYILQMCQLNKGLVLVTGPTGSGKSTTLCAMVDYINRNRADHIITIEDPIEFVHENKKCLLNQREVHTHTDGFTHALRAALREDPDIVLVGEMRDLETVAIAIETAETGHLVFGAMHTTTAASTVDRVIDQFPTDRQAQIRIMLSESLRCVVAQTLCKKIGGGRVAALEVLIVTSAVSNLIREGKTFQIPSIMQVGKSVGMVSLSDALMDLVAKKLVAPEEAYSKAVDKAGFEGLLKRAGIDTKFTVPANAAS